MISIVTSSSAQALAWALVHFFWQGAALGLIAFAVLRSARLSAGARHGVGVVTLAAMMAAPVATFGWIVTRSEISVTGATSAVGALAVTAAPAAGASASLATDQGGQNSLLILVLLAWLTGVAGLSVRLFGGWVVARRFVRRSIAPVTPEIHALARRMAGRMALERVVQVYESAAVTVPMMLGWLKPVILLPAAAVGGLTPIQIEALLAHELAHVRRQDYLVNLLQSAVETLLFYHPAVWWVSGQVREEREHCCDDLAISVCGDRVVYVAALADLAAMTTPRLALAASDGSLASRVRRILGEPRDRGSASMGWTPAVLALLLLTALVPLLAARVRHVETADATTAGGTIATLVDAVSPEPLERPQADRVLAGVVELRLPIDQEPSAAQLRDQLDEAKKALAELQRRLEELKGTTEERRKELAARKAVAEELSERTPSQERLREVFEQKIAELEERRLQFEKENQDANNSQIKDITAQERALKQDLEKSEKAFQSAAQQRGLFEKLDQSFREKAEKESQVSALNAEEIIKKLEQNRQQLEFLRRQAGEHQPELLKQRAEVQDLENELAAYKARIAQRDSNHATVFMAASAVLEPGNVLTVELRGENGRLSVPDVRIAPDGTVKLPWIGTVAVKGLTLQQSEETLLKALAARRDLIDGKPVKAVVVTTVRKRE